VLQFVPGEFAIPEDLGQKATTNGLTPVDRNNGASPIGMPQKMVAALDPDNIKPEPSQQLDDLGTTECGHRAHAMTATRWTPMNRLETGFSTSKHNTMAS